MGDIFLMKTDGIFKGLLNLFVTTYDILVKGHKKTAQTKIQHCPEYSRFAEKTT